MESSCETKPVSRLITFPGVRVVPEWRKELGERVREVQEQRAREAAIEAEAAERLRQEEPNAVEPDATSTQLELLPQAEMVEMNPLVAKALARIERARQSPAAAGAYRNTTYGANAVAAAAAQERLPSTEFEPEPAPERTHNLVVVPSPISREVPLTQESLETEVSQMGSYDEELHEPESHEADSHEADSQEASPHEAASVTKPKPRRVIAEDLDDPALSYLDSIPLAGGPVTAPARASIPARLVAAAIDLIAVGFLALPFAAIIELQDANWRAPRTLGLMAGIVAVVMFIYATVSTALTGRTLGMRLIRLRAIDVRTGLIPTGTQSATRALVYLLSPAMLGFGLLLAFARGEGKTAHDRVSRTAVVRD
jgi:uncharacterized RDD family membrane protein YckC